MSKKMLTFEIYFLVSDLMSSHQEVGVRWEPSLWPRSGSSATNKTASTATAPNTGVTRRPQCQDPKPLAVSDPTM